MSTKAFKQDKISLIKEKIDKAQVAIVTEYNGYSVEEITNLRRALQKEDGDYMVTKNTLAKLAVKDTPYEVLTETFKGPIAIAFGFGDQVAPAKALSKFIKDTKKGEIIAAAMISPFLVSLMKFDNAFAGATWSPKPNAIAIGPLKVSVKTS